MHKLDFMKRVKLYFHKNNKIIAYGASARSSTFLNYCGIDRKDIKYIVDKNPLKINKFTPGTNLKIISFEQFKKQIKKFNILLLLAWNFKSEIMKDLITHGFKGKIITPFPRKINIQKI